MQGGAFLLVSEQLEVITNTNTRQMRRDDFIDEPALSCDHRVCKLALVLQRLLLDVLPSEDDFDGPLGAHYGDLRRWPRIVEVTPQVLRRHHVVRATIGLAGDDRYLGHRGLGEREEQLGAVPNDAAVLLVLACNAR